MDRADIIQYVDLPSREAIYEILRSCLCEIISKGIVDTVVCAIDIYTVRSKSQPLSTSTGGAVLEASTDT